MQKLNENQHFFLFWKAGTENRNVIINIESELYHIFVTYRFSV